MVAVSCPRTRLGMFPLVVVFALPQAVLAQDTRETRRAWEIHIGLGFGDAAGCKADEGADSSMNGAMDAAVDDAADDCWIDGAAAGSLGGGYRLHPHWALGLELSGWSFNVPDGWRGSLDTEATDVSVGMSQVALYGRFYWYDERLWDPYFQAGIGYGGITGTAENTDATFEVNATGPIYHVGLGVDYIVHPIFRVGAQWLAALLVASEICTDDGDTKECRAPEKNADGGREGLALPWRLALTGTFVFGER